jgi:hypothetical protein
MSEALDSTGPFVPASAEAPEGTNAPPSIPDTIGRYQVERRWSESARNLSAGSTIDYRRLVTGLAAVLIVGGTVLLLNASSVVGNTPYSWGYAVLGLGSVAVVVRLAMRSPPKK